MTTDTNEKQTLRIERLTDEVKELRAVAKAARKSERLAEDVHAAVFGLKAEGPRPAWLTPKTTAPGAPGMPMTIWSDWHLGEVVTSSETNGQNVFNWKVAEERITKLVNKTSEMCFSHMAKADFPGIVVALGGDMVSGDIHEILRQTNETTLLPTIRRGAGLIIAGLRQIADKFERVFVPCVSGNHGRTTKRIEHKLFTDTNADNMIYMLVRDALEGDTRFHFHIPASNEAHFQVYGHRFLLLHGHDLGVRGGDGIIGSIGPITRGKLKVGAQARAMGKDFDTLIIGHWHQYIQLRGLIVNGTLKGFDGFANSGLRAAPEPAQQALWFLHPKYGITARWPIFLQAERTAGRARKVLSWEAE